MKRISLGLILSLSLTLAAQTTPPPSATAPKPPETKEPTAAQQFKNIQVMKDVPASEWFPTMQFIAGSLGVSCHYCHVNPFAKDEKPEKARAREMMKMVQAINAQNFADQSNRVTCDTCHRGSPKPAKSPSVEQAKWLPLFLSAGAEKGEQPAASPAFPDAQSVIARYRTAVGAANAAKIRSRYYKGTLTLYEGDNQPNTLEQVIYLAGEQVRVDATGPQGTQSTIYDGKRGWVVTAKSTTAMSEEDVSNLRARVLGSLKIDALPQFTAATVKSAEEFRGHQTWAVEFTLNDQRTNTYYFDQQSGLLVGRRGAVVTAFGKMPEETWFDDYRDFGGVKLPMTITNGGVSRAQSQRYDEIQLNLPVDQKRFEPPAAGTGTGN